MTLEADAMTYVVSSGQRSFGPAGMFFYKTNLSAWREVFQGKLNTEMI
jgi:hypothetical protein